MTSAEQRGIAYDRVTNPIEVDIHLFECFICRKVLWKPAACQTCKTAFCSPCINQWLGNNPIKCPKGCAKYIERNYPPDIVKRLAPLKIACFYKSKGCLQVILYELLDKHENECGYQPQQCLGCRSEILKKDFDNHKRNCASIELTCPDCNLVYKRGDAGTQHTYNICLRQQLQELRDESKKNTSEMQELIRQLNRMPAWRNYIDHEVTINFNDLPVDYVIEKNMPNMYRGLKWTQISYGHEFCLKRKHSNSGFATAFTPGSNSQIAYFSEEASISIEPPNETFTFVSLTACAAWNDDLQLTITGYRKSGEINTYTTTLQFGKPQPILLHWKNINKVTFKPSGGTPHPGSAAFAQSHVIVTQLTIAPLD